jgi:hypothetical protein
MGMGTQSHGLIPADPRGIFSPVERPMIDTGRQGQAGWFRWWYLPLGAVILALATVPFIRISYQNASTWKIG